METDIRNKLLQCLPGQEDFVDKHLLEPFCMSDDTLQKIRDLLNTKISQAFNPETREQTTQQLWPSYVTNRIETIEDGTYLVLDLGGTNLRVMSVTITGNTTTSEMTSDVIPMSILRGNGAELFDFIADKLYQFTKTQNLLNSPKPLPLGFTFSFPVDQKGINVAILQSWTKEFVCCDVIGKDVGKLMQNAIDKHLELNVRCVAIINDTVGTLMAGAFIDKTCTVGLICGTGTNGCYLETQETLNINLKGFSADTRVAVDTMWNNFGNDGAVDFARSPYDFEISQQATHPNQAQCEKMMCALFAGEVVRHVILKLHKDGICFKTLSPQMQQKDGLTTETLSNILLDETETHSKVRVILGTLGLDDVTDAECHLVYLICKLVTMRAAALVAACLACLINRMNLPENGIAVDGSFYRGNHLFPDMCFNKMKNLVNPGLKYHFVPCQDGSGLGAALVAAMKHPDV